MANLCCLISFRCDHVADIVPDFISNFSHTFHQAAIETKNIKPWFVLGFPHVFGLIVYSLEGLGQTRNAQTEELLVARQKVSDRATSVT